MSGHSKWATTKRHKAAIDAKRANAFTKLARIITVAAKTGKNLDLAVETARKANMPKDNIQRAIDKGTGKIQSEEIIETTYEAYAPGGVGIIIKVLTDNKNRAVSEIKGTLNKYNGTLANAGAVSYLFENKGVILINLSENTQSQEDLEMYIIESGAQDYEKEEGVIYVYTSPTELMKIKENLEKSGIKIEKADIEMSPKTYVDVSEDKKSSILNLLEILDSLDDVSEVYTNANL